MLLGNVATSESGFFQEYGQYSTNIARIGAMAEGTNFTYAAGFPDGGCGPIAVAPLPGAANPTLPLNFGAGVPGPAVAGGGLLTSVIGRVTNNVVVGPRVLCATAAAGVFAAVGVVAPAGGAQGTYVASATGNIVDPNGPNGSTCPAGLPTCDQWYINQDRTLRNTNDGVQN